MQTKQHFMDRINELEKWIELYKALAKGKPIQAKFRDPITNEFRQWADCRTGLKEFTSPVEDYRIKPEEPKFKVGDWVRQKTRVFQYSYTDLQYDKANPTHCQNDEKWEPKEGEICIFWDSVDNDARISKFSHMKQEEYSTAFHTWNYCMPFTGTLPPHMKDSK